MGGDHHSLGERAKIPDYTIYKVENYPELIKHREVLAARGLKDPWIRNECWRFDTKEWGTHGQNWRTFFFRGFKLGFGAFVATIAIDAALKAMSKKPEGHH